MVRKVRFTAIFPFPLLSLPCIVPNVIFHSCHHGTLTILISISECFRDDDMDPAHAERLWWRRERERDKRASETPERREERLRVRRERDRARRAIRVANATADATQGPPAAVKCCPEGTALCRKCRPETGPTAAEKCSPDRTTCC